MVFKTRVGVVLSIGVCVAGGGGGGGQGGGRTFVCVRVCVGSD